MASTKADDEELKKLMELAVAETPASDAYPPCRNVAVTERALAQLERFVVDLAIKPGNTRIHCFYLWYLYVHWAPEPMKQKQFYFTIKQIFRRIRTTPGPLFHYMLDSPNFDPELFDYNTLRARIREEYMMGNRKWHVKKIK